MKFGYQTQMRPAVRREILVGDADVIVQFKFVFDQRACIPSAGVDEQLVLDNRAADIEAVPCLVVRVPFMIVGIVRNRVTAKALIG